MAYVTGEVEVAGVREGARERLPEHMVPAAVVVLEKLPLTPNGKLDRKALPEPEWGVRGEAYVAPRTVTEEVLAGIWAEVLGVERVGVGENFFDLGGHSLLATRVMARAQAALGAEIPLRAIFETPTVAGLAEQAEVALREGAGVQAPAIVRVPRDGSPLPLSFAQARLWFIDQLQPGSAAYNVPVPLRVRGAVDARALAAALSELARRHEPLRTVFRVAGGEPVQVVLPAAPVALPTVDLRALSPEAREIETGRLAAEDAARPFDLARGPLLRTTLVRSGEGELALLVNMHHIVSDGWSLEIFFRELSALYEAFAEGRPSPLAELPVQYADYAVWQRAWLSEEALEGQLGFWKEQLRGAPPLLEIPTDRPRAPGQSARGGAHPFTVSPEATRGLRALSRREGATLFMTVLAAWQALLGRYARQEDVVVGTPIAGRTRTELEGLIGFFVNMLAMRADLGGDPTWAEMLGRTRRAALGAYAHQDVPFERLVDELDVERSLMHAPLFQVVFALQKPGGDERLSLGEAQAEPSGGGEHVAKVDLTLNMVEGEEGLFSAILYREALFDAAMVVRMATHLEVLLEGLAANPERRLSEVPLLRGAERAQLLHAWNGADTGYTGELCIHELFHVQVLRNPDAPALSFHGRTLSYAALYHGASRLARRLRREGVGPETRVGICMEPAPEMIVSVLGVLLAGGAYLPLDPDLPSERRAYMLHDAAPALLLTQAGFAERLADTGVPLLCVDAEAGSIAQESDRAPESGVGPDNLAYVIYTSGSTGRPKGVLVAHRGVGNTLLELGRVYGVGPGDRNLLFAPLHFDSSVAEMFVALVNGAELVVTRREDVLPGEDLLRTLREERITHVKTMPSALAVTPVEPLPELRSIGTGGEMLPAEVVRRWGAGRRFLSGYGATEASIRMAATAYTCEDGRDPPVGHPVPNTQLYVLDRWLEPAPVGVAGELYIGGVGVVRGYLGRPDLTAERFLPDPHRGVPGARLYRTGDVGRRRADGEIDFLGRTDHQVKVRGYRVELGEIEAMLRAHARVKEAVVLLREDVPGQQRLVAYVTGEDGAGPTAAELREHVAEQAPDYMVPRAYVVLDRLPVTPNNKIDRRALPAPEWTDAEEYVAPRTAVEEVLAGIWAEVLGVERVGVGENFFDLGGHSLLATRVVSRIREVLSVELPLRTLFEEPVVAGLAERVEALRRAGQPVLPPVLPVERRGALPLSFAQERLWFLDRLQPGSGFYNIPRALRLEGELAPRALEGALGEIVRRHEALRTTFAEVEGVAAQVVVPFGGFALPVEDLSGLEDGERAAVVKRRVTEHAARPFDLERGPLFRAALLRLNAEEHVLLLCVHHVVSDGWSMGVLFGELSALYGAYREGAESPLPELAVQYADYAAWQREQLEGEALERQIGYWKERLAGAPELLELPTDHPRPAVQTYRGATEPVALPGELLERLEALARREGVTLYMVLLGAFQVLLSKYAGSEDVVVGSPIAGRTRGEVEGLIGFFVNTLVLRTDLSGDPGFREVLRRVREGTLGAYEHQEVPFEKLVAELQPERSLSHSPLFQVMFALQNAGGAEGTLPGLRLQGLGAEQESAKFDLSLGLATTPQGLLGDVSYSTELFERGTIARMVGHLERVLEQVARDAEVRLSGVELLGEAERAQVVEEWNRTEAGYPSDRCLHQMFEAQAARTPEAVAVVFEEESLSYGALNARANRLAHHLRGLGVGPEVRVAICVERSLEMVVGLLGILKAGGAYVPLDPGYPAERLAYMLADCGAPVLLTQEELRGALPAPEGVRVVSGAEVAGEPAENPASGATPRDLAYVIYTSGSTGRPKGVMVEHGGVVSLLHWLRSVTSDAELSCVLGSTSFSFDVSVAEIFGTLCWGGRLELVENALALASVPEEAGVRLSYMVPSVAAELLRAGALPRGVSTLYLAGEALPAALAQALYEAGVERVFNVYGPTEDTVYATAAEVERGAERVSIGRPIANARVYVADGRLEPAPVGVPGELYLGGAGVARGYLGRPELTAERFVPDPFGGKPGARLYRTGDRVRWRAEGVLEYQGRIDTQVKVRGFRIELGEIEAALLRHEGARECVVVAREEEDERQLVAYVVGDVDAGALREQLRAELPAYMVPGAFVVLERAAADAEREAGPEGAAGAGVGRGGGGVRGAAHRHGGGAGGDLGGGAGSGAGGGGGELLRPGRALSAGDAGGGAGAGGAGDGDPAAGALRGAHRRRAGRARGGRAPRGRRGAGPADRAGATGRIAAAAVVRAGAALVHRPAGAGERRLQHGLPAAAARRAGRAGSLGGAHRAGAAARVAAHRLRRRGRRAGAGRPPRRPRPPSRRGPRRAAGGSTGGRGEAAGGGRRGPSVRPGPRAAPADDAGPRGRGGARAAGEPAPHRQRRVEHGRLLPRALGAVRRLPPPRAAGAVRRLRRLAAGLADGRRAADPVPLLARAPGGDAPPAGAAHRSPPPGRRRRPRRRGRAPPLPRGHAGPALARPARGRDALHRAPGRLPGAPLPLRGERGRAGGHGRGRPRPAGDGGADRLLRQHAGDPRRACRRLHGAGAGGAGPGAGAGGARAPGPPLRAPGGGAARGAHAGPRAALPGDVHLRLRGSGGRGAAGRGGGGGAGDAERAGEVRPDAGDGLRRGAAGGGDLLPRGAVGRRHHRADGGAPRGAAGGAGPRAGAARPGAAAAGRRRARAGAGGVERDGARAAGRRVRARTLRGPGAPHAGRGRGGARDRAGDVRGAGPPLRPAGERAAQAGRRTGEPRRRLHAAYAGAAGGPARRAARGRRVRAAGPGVPARAAGLHAGGRTRRPGPHRAGSRRSAAGERGRSCLRRRFGGVRNRRRRAECCRRTCRT